MIDEIMKEKIENFNIKGNTADIVGTIIIIVIIIFFYYIKSLSENKGTLIIILILFLIIISLNNNLKKNENFTNIKLELKDIYSELNTGDFVLFRSYDNNDIGYIVFMKLFLPFFQEKYFTHIGMIYKLDNGETYITEMEIGDNYCEYKKKIVKDGIMMKRFDKRINESQNYRIHIVKTNIHEYINIDKLKNSIEKYKDYTFDKINCIDYVTRLLYDSDIMKLPIGILQRYFFDDLFNKDNYNFDIKFEKPITIIDF